MKTTRVLSTGLTCPAVNAPSFIEVTPASCNIQSTTSGNSCQFRCRQSGYELMDSNGQTVDESIVNCDENGQWQPNDYMALFECLGKAQSGYIVLTESNY